jgi:predicted  nucleic acid-binding Zn-ribbon protein
MKLKTISIAVLLFTSTALTIAADDKTAAPDAKASSTASTPAAKAWAYSQVQRPADPSVKQKAWVRTPIDAFVLAKLEAKGLKPSPDTDRATFIRRATLDSWGLIPTPEEVQAFVNDRSPNAYEKLADRLLSSPHYGERQARRWLDLARYADSAGFQNDQTRPNNYRYRDYVINVFNSDKPFDRFIKEQLAGDELWPDNQEAKVATGFLAGYPDNYNSRDLVQRKYQIATDMTDMVGETFLAATVGCARCHNHKADRVSQKEYFQLQAFFANTSFDDRVPAAKGEAELAYEKQQAVYRDATKDIRAKQKAILDTVREVGVKYHKERYLTDSREAIFKPEKEWTAMDRWVNFRLKSVSTEQDVVAYLRLSAEDKDSEDFKQENVEKWKQYQKLTADLRKFDKLRPEKGSLNLTAATELGHADSPPTQVRFGGVHERPLEEVQPGLPALWAGNAKPQIVPTANSSGRRTALANWLASTNNPLTARVFVNRVWSQYFADGIVSTVADFGRAGQKPTNPELLDYLAADFMEKGWSVKKLHRQILLSSVYRQSSSERADVLKADPDNKLLAVYPRKRLEAEQIRDSLLAASGQLEDKVGGPAVFPPVPSNFSAGQLWTPSADPHEINRRSVYVFVRRSVPYPLTQSFDPADPSQAHHKRSVTTTPLQALTLFNSDVVFGWSQALAGRVIREAGKDETAQLNRLYEILFARAPSKSERVALKDFLDKQEKIIQAKTSDGKFAVAVPTGLKQSQQINPVRAAALVDLVHTVANSNDFAYRF